ncbi:MAG: 6-carboxytetrahydropterin synthase QueD [Eggerthellaceae bacterium]|nr:6-carboxytetrahydropterin synthase QueD [Eggerthellaceae bacterium]
MNDIKRNKPYEGKLKLSGEAFKDVRGSYVLTVKDHFDAAHFLAGYDGPCQFLHGHTWDVEVSVCGQSLDGVGIVYDLKALKDDLHAILENFDHRFINEVKPFDEINPTAENLARILFAELSEVMPEGIRVKEAAVWESPIAKVSFVPDACC